MKAVGLVNLHEGALRVHLLGEERATNPGYSASHQFEVTGVRPYTSPTDRTAGEEARYEGGAASEQERLI